MTTANGNAKAAFLGPAKTAAYRPSFVPTNFLWGIDGNLRFRWRDVEAMRVDPQIAFGLRILRAPLATVTWEVECDNADVAAWVDRTLKKFWQRHLHTLTRCLEYGSVGGEICWTQDQTTGAVEFAEFRDVAFFDSRPLQLHGKLAGLSVKGARSGPNDPNPGWLLPPRSLWISLDAENGQFYGRPRLFGAWQPWREKSGRHGAIDVRRLWFLKNAFRGAVGYHPVGNTDRGDGTIVSNQDYMREVVEKAETGGVYVFPSITDEQGNQLWRIDWAEYGGEVHGIREYPQDLDVEILKGMGIPPEVVEAAASGSGWSGRSIPFLVFLTGEDQVADTIIQAIDQQALRPAVTANYGESVKYEIKVKSLVPPAQEQPGGGMGGAGMNQGDESGGARATQGWSYTGPRGGRGVRDPETGKIRYERLSHERAKGRWITIGGKKGDDGERHGGSPVYIENGRITKEGNPEPMSEEDAYESALEQLRDYKASEVEADKHVPFADQFSTQSDEWSPYEGPHGGRGWKNSRTGNIVYGNEKPGDNTPHADDKLADVTRSGWDRFKAIGHQAAHIEHVAKEWVTSKVAEKVARLPEALQLPVHALWKLTRLGTVAAFATYTAGQKAAEAVARERGATPEQLDKMRAVCSVVNLTGAKAVPLTLGAIGLGGLALPASFVPIGSAAYLAYATVAHPVATLNAARKAVAAAARWKVQTLSLDARAAADLAALCDGIKAHEGDGDEYLASVFAALDDAESLGEALEVAEEATRQTERLSTFNESDHPRGQPGNAGQFGPGSGSGNASSGNGGSPTPPTKPPARNIVEHGEAVAKSARQNMRTLLSKLKSGEYHPEDVVSDADIYSRRSQDAMRAGWARKYKELREQVEQKYGDHTTRSKEWRNVRRAFELAALRSGSFVAAMAGTVKSVIEEKPEETPRVTKGVTNRIDQLHDDMVSDHYKNIGLVGDALDAFKEVHRPVGQLSILGDWREFEQVAPTDRLSLNRLPVIDPAIRAKVREQVARLARDASGHLHKGKGKGGGQFTSQGGQAAEPTGIHPPAPGDLHGNLAAEQQTKLGPADPVMGQAIAQHVVADKEANRYSTGLALQDLFTKLQATSPNITVEKLKDQVLHLAKQGVIRLKPYTRALAALGDAQRFLIPKDGESMLYVEPVGERLSEESETPPTPAEPPSLPPEAKPRRKRKIITRDERGAISEILEVEDDAS